MMLGSAGMYFFNHGEVARVFESLGYPNYIIYPLAAARAWNRFDMVELQSFVKEWAHAGFFYDFVLAAAAHISIGDGEFIPVLVAIVILAISYVFWKRSDNSAKED